MPVYNGLPYLQEALDDLLAQTAPDFELVAVDDGSTDGSLAVLKAYAERDARIVIVRNEENLGLTPSLNRGLERCRAPLVARADADDRYEPDRLERQRAFLDAHPDVGLLSCAVHKMNAEGKRFLTRHFPTEDGPIRIRELFVNSFSHPGVMFRADLVREVGGYDTAYWTAEDCDLWARLMPRTRVANLPVPLVHYRKHGASIVQSNGAEVEALDLSVRRRQLSAYLQREVSIEEARAAVALYRASRRLTGDEVAAGVRVLREVLRRAREREGPATVRFFVGEVGEALVKQARRQEGGSRALGLRLVLEAVRWDPRRGLTRETVASAVRSVWPRST